MNKNQITLQKQKKLEHQKVDQHVKDVLYGFDYINQNRKGKEVLCGISMVKIHKTISGMYEIKQFELPKFQVDTKGLLKTLFNCSKREDLYCSNVSEPLVDLKTEI